MSDQKVGRRRRSSSLLYQEPPETIEHMSDQAALPNLNANWVNAKGKFPLEMDGIIRGRTDLIDDIDSLPSQASILYR
jgi:hypothetical protein